MRQKHRIRQTRKFDKIAFCMDESNKQITLADALAKIETLTAQNIKFGSDLETANTKISELESELSAEKTAHSETKTSLATLEAKNRDIDNEVSSKVAKIAAESGVAPVENVSTSGSDESIEDLAKRIDATEGVEKAKLIESNYARIMAAVKGNK